jgi:hypothetical protein
MLRHRLGTCKKSVRRFIKRIEDPDCTDEDIRIAQRLVEVLINKAKELLKERARKMN